MTSLRRLDELRGDARYHRDCRDLYRAEMYGPRPASLVQLRSWSGIASCLKRASAGPSKNSKRRRYGYGRWLSDETRPLNREAGAQRQTAAFHAKCLFSPRRA
jgi:hypothetical protein